jgi:hypothetical protein
MNVYFDCVFYIALHPALLKLQRSGLGAEANAHSSRASLPTGDGLSARLQRGTCSFGRQCHREQVLSWLPVIKTGATG